MCGNYNFREFLQQSNESLICEISGFATGFNVELMKFFLVFCLFRKDFVLFEEMNKFLVIDSVRLMFNSLERDFDSSHVKLFGIKLEDRLKSWLDFSRWYLFLASSCRLRWYRLRILWILWLISLGFELSFIFIVNFLLLWLKIFF